jgi:hypothetical protein
VDPAGNGSTFVILNDRRIVFEITSNGVPISTGGLGHLFWLYQGGRGYFVTTDPQACTKRTWETISLTGLTASDFGTTTHGPASGSRRTSRGSGHIRNEPQTLG